MKSEAEINEKLEELLSADTRMSRTAMYSKVAACKALAWALGINDDDRWYITATSGPMVDSRAKDRN